jgi:ribonuclease HII
LGNPLKPYYKKDVAEAGCDEAGRGCLAGPVFAAAVILPEDFTHPVLNDSKKLSEKKRYELREVIEKYAICHAVASVDHEEIDKINILNASIKAMHLALTKLQTRPGHIIVDGNKFHPFEKIPHICIVDGDALYLSIAAASILAKTYRDDFMTKIHEEYPMYNWKKHKGYATKEHREAITKYGISPYHRRTFLKNYNQFSLNF